MAGHSQFKNIMHRKGQQDAIKSKLFSKLAREITVAAKEGGPDPDANARLRLAVQNARAQSMPKDNIERAISKGAGGDGEGYEEVRYEGYGPGGVAMIVEALTDNRNRTAGAVRSYFTKYGGAMGETGSVAFMFDRVGEIVYPASAGERRRGARGGDRSRRQRRDERRGRPCHPHRASRTRARSRGRSRRSSARRKRSTPSGSRRR